MTSRLRRGGIAAGLDRTGGRPRVVTEEDEVLTAFSGVIESLHLCRADIDKALSQAERICERRREGLAYAEVLAELEGPQVRESLTAVLGELSGTGGRLRRAEARALSSEGLSMERIAMLFGVSRQRVSSLLQSSSVEVGKPPAERHRRGLALTDPEFPTIADAPPHIVWVADPSGEIEYFNDHGTGFPHGPASVDDPGQAWLGQVHPDDDAEARRAWKHANGSGTPFELDFRIRRSDGAWRWHAFRALPCRGPGGRISKWLGTAADIHDFKVLQVELQRVDQRPAGGGAQPEAPLMT